MKTIMQDIENNEIRQFYLLYGEEDYLKTQYRNRLVNALVSPDDNMNYSVYDGKSFDVKSFLELGETMPFFSDNRVIVLQNSGVVKKTPADFESRIEQFPESTHVIFVENEVDKRSRLYKWFGKNGYAVEMVPPDEPELKKWIAMLCKKEGKQIYENALDYFLEAVGNDMMLIRNELEKVFGYCIDSSEITIDDIKQVCVSQAQDHLYAMMDAIGSRNRERALLLYRDLLALKEPPMIIMYNISLHFKRMLEIAELSKAGKNVKEMAAIYHIPYRAVNNYVNQIKQYDLTKLKYMLDKCQETEERIKTGLVKDIVGVELLIVEFSS